ncbi:membrane protein-like protein [Chloroherpeton thalassium ATCC 35110]|uniref:Membrane protein-like protein n=1 Tax=Chloroherpeton thalassium (strain ATCC 35110 / GB-78) TaxID=517418 RepID=B3QU09_CHLT3|nr:DedA family protein [Chloroherpeton thalassium]ACF12807.1 membrane protein-like protein [Chloroherpeton thalassium ATCC 35110]
MRNSDSLFSEPHIHNKAPNIEQPNQPAQPKKLKEKIRSLAVRTSESPFGCGLLFLIGLIEATLIPMPADEVLISLGALKPRRALSYSFALIAGAVVGSLIGYAIGYMAYHTVGTFLIEKLGWEQAASQILNDYRHSGLEILLTSGFIPLPYALFTVLAGANETLPVVPFVIAGAIGRTVRFLPVGVVLRLFGAKLAPYVEHHLDKIIMIFAGFMLTFFAIRVWLGSF